LLIRRCEILEREKALTMLAKEPEIKIVVEHPQKDASTSINYIDLKKEHAVVEEKMVKDEVTENKERVLGFVNYSQE